MSSMFSVKLSPKGLKRLKTGHPWIFISDVAGDLPDESQVVKIEGHREKFIALALFSANSQIALRVISYKPLEIDREWFRNKITHAASLRKRFDIPSNAQRLVFGESDGLPGLIVDRFSDVISFSTLCGGIDRFKEEIVSVLCDEFKPRAVVERNDVPVRKIEGLPLTNEVVFGECPDLVAVNEGSLTFGMDIKGGQKTGAYLDQRDNRLLAAKLAYGRTLDCFCYEGWFAAHMAARSECVLCVDSSKPALENASKNAKRNKLESVIHLREDNCFDFLKQEDVHRAHYDCINLDPPPFVKSQRDFEAGYRGYKEINLRAMKLLRPKGVLITSSCSYHFREGDFDAMLADCAQDAGVNAYIIYRRNAAPDHPVLTSFPESNYLKCRVLLITDRR